MNENDSPDERETKILTDEEKDSFDGVTIEEEGNSVREETQSARGDGSQDWYPENGRRPSSGNESFGNERFKVYRFSSGSLLTTVIIGLIIVAFLVIAFFFSGIFLIGAAIAAVIGLVLSVFQGLF